MHAQLHILGLAFKLFLVYATKLASLNARRCGLMTWLSPVFELPGE